VKNIIIYLLKNNGTSKIALNQHKKANKLTGLKILCIQHFTQDEEKETFNNLVNNTDLKKMIFLNFYLPANLNYHFTSV
jgi:hypothetical protein